MMLIFVPPRMTTLDHASHSLRRKAYAPHYTLNNVVSFEPDIQELSLELVNVSNLPSLQPQSVYSSPFRFWNVFAGNNPLNA